jgi:hypothetical protein
MVYHPKRVFADFPQQTNAHHHFPVTGDATADIVVCSHI